MRKKKEGIAKNGLEGRVVGGERRSALDVASPEAETTEQRSGALLDRGGIGRTAEELQ